MSLKGWRRAKAMPDWIYDADATDLRVVIELMYDDMINAINWLLERCPYAEAKKGSLACLSCKTPCISQGLVACLCVVDMGLEDAPESNPYTMSATSESCQEHYKSRYNCEEWREMIDELMVEVKGLVTIVEMVLFGFKANYTEDDVAGLIRDALWHHCDLVVKEEKHERY